MFWAAHIKLSKAPLQAILHKGALTEAGPQAHHHPLFLRGGEMIITMWMNMKVKIHKQIPSTMLVLMLAVMLMSMIVLVVAPRMMRRRRVSTMMMMMMMTSIIIITIIMPMVASTVSTVTMSKAVLLQLTTKAQ